MDLSKLAEELKIASEISSFNNIIETKVPLTLNQAKKIRDDYFSGCSEFVGIAPLNQKNHITPERAEVNSYVAVVRGKKDLGEDYGTERFLHKINDKIKSKKVGSITDIILTEKKYADKISEHYSGNPNVSVWGPTSSFCKPGRIVMGIYKKGELEDNQNA